MAATNLHDSDSNSQGLIRYLKDASQCSRDNIFLRELGNASNLEHQLHVLLRDWIVAQARAMLVQWIEAYQDGDHQPKLPNRQTNPEAETPDLGSFFADRKRASMIRRAETVSEQKRWSRYFEAWGCLVCQRRDVPHDSNGMCGVCKGRTYGRLKRLSE